jgi:hypothetical protein
MGFVKPAVQRPEHGIAGSCMNEHERSNKTTTARKMMNDIINNKKNGKEWYL